MKTYKRLFQQLISIENLEEAYQKARKHKTNNPVVIEFDKHAQLHIVQLRKELLAKTYTPQSLKTFVLRDPKTRVICVSAFRDRIVHHALVNVLQPVFEPRFIYDSYASRVGKGTLPALKRLTQFLRKVAKNGSQVTNTTNANAVHAYLLKADIKHYFDTVDHDVLLQIIEKRVKDKDVLWLVRKILNNYHTQSGKGMPLGNWTSQFFANVYLNELDQFVKHQLKAIYYVRYVDDFIILHQSKGMLQYYEQRIKTFLQTLQIELHPFKTKINPVCRGITFLGFRVFYQYTRVRQRNLRKILNKLKELLGYFAEEITSKEEILEVLHGWNAYAMHGDTYKLRKQLIAFVEQELQKRL